MPNLSFKIRLHFFFRFCELRKSYSSAFFGGSSGCYFRVFFAGTSGPGSSFFPFSQFFSRLFFFFYFFLVSLLLFRFVVFFFPYFFLFVLFFRIVLFVDCIWLGKLMLSHRGVLFLAEPFIISRKFKSFTVWHFDKLRASLRVTTSCLCCRNLFRV